MIDSILFSLDNTLVMTRREQDNIDVGRCGQVKFLKDAGIDLMGLSDEEVFARLRVGWSKYETLHRHSRKELLPEMIIQEYVCSFLDLTSSEVERIAGEMCRLEGNEGTYRWARRNLNYVLHHLSYYGHNLGLIAEAYSLQNVEEVLDKMGISRYFTSVICTAELGRSFPHPILFNACISELGTSAEDCVFVGCSEDMDMRGAASVGISRRILIGEDTSGIRYHTKRVHSLFELLDVIDDYHREDGDKDYEKYKRYRRSLYSK